jgi:glycogen debranching enzyme
MRRSGDVDGDSLIEYPTVPSAFLWNQGWKDSWDGITFADGQLATGPIALVEVQGYAYAAYLAAAELREFLERGDPEELRTVAKDLAAALRRDMWMDDQAYFATALDGNKQRIDSITSNAGHLLWSGVLSQDDAAAVARRLLAPDCFTGFGIRTLSSAMGAYNPLSYHNGSVWPHDNAIAIAGMMRYGLVDEARRAAEALLGAAPWFDYRLPELFGGFDVSEYPFPVPYPTACSPQAWSAGAPLLVLRAFLGLEPDLHRGVIYLDPQLPDGLYLEIGGVRMGEGRLTLRAEGTDVEVEEVPPGVEVVRGRRPVG